MKFVAGDGKQFSSPDACFAYEKSEEYLMWLIDNYGKVARVRRPDGYSYDIIILSEGRELSLFEAVIEKTEGNQYTIYTDGRVVENYKFTFADVEMQHISATLVGMKKGLPPYRECTLVNNDTFRLDFWCWLPESLYNGKVIASAYSKIILV